MSDQAQYQNMMANLNNINQAGKEVVNEKKEDMEQKLEGWKKTLELTTEGIGGGIVHDTGLNLVKYGVEKLKDHLPIPIDEMKAMIADYKDGGAEKMLKGMTKRGYSKAKQQMFGDVDDDDAEGAVKKVFGKIFQSSDAQSPSTIKLPSSVDDALQQGKSAVKSAVKSDAKDVDFKSIDNQKDFNQAQQDLNDRVSKLPQENQDNIAQKLNDNPDVKTSDEISKLPKEQRLAEKVKQSEARQTATGEEEDSLKVPEIPKPIQGLQATDEDASSTSKGFFQSLLDKVKQPPKPVIEDDDTPTSLQQPKTISQDSSTPNIKSNVDDDLVSTAEKEGEDEAKGEGKSLLEKVASRVGETDLEGGGPEDPFGDVISGIVGIGTLLGGIFGAKSKHLKPVPTFNALNPSFQAGA